MKATELQIGDWVAIDEPCKYAGAIGRVKTLIDHKDDENAYFKVFLQNNMIHIGIEDICSDDIRPITLTPEILEKNGFKFDKEDGWWWLSPKIGITFWEEGDIELELENKHSSVNIHINYLHQLQHALRLCGIKKEIKL